MEKLLNNITNFIFPLVTANKKGVEHYDYGELIGTAFLIGNNGYALTAAHVIEQCFQKLDDSGVILALFWEGSGWYVKEVTSTENHETEDVGIIRVADKSKNSILKINDNVQPYSCEYRCWGYPHDVAKEVQKIYEGVIERPELIYSQGYVRRIISRELGSKLLYRGNHFYELSEQVGGGNSGAPLIIKNKANENNLEFFGIYVGEKDPGNVSYAVRSEAFANWIPNILNKSIKDESLNNNKT